MKITYLFPTALFLLLAAFFMFLPNLKHCALPRCGDCRRIDRKDALIMGLISIVYAAIAFTALGNTKSPESFVPMQSRTLTLELSDERSVGEIKIFSGVGEGSCEIEFSENGEVWFHAASFKQEHVNVLKWNSIIPDIGLKARFVRFTGSGGLYFGEVCFNDTEGLYIPAALPESEGDASAELLIDEQELLPKKQHFLNSSYFDEIYHPRTAWEHLNGIYPYEVSHPPLGKLIISIGVSLFGMTPFGWRFMGTLFGVLMLPVMYVFVKKLFGGRTVATACTIVFASDFMHFVQTRIATIDTYGVFFTLLMYLFMYLFIDEYDGEGTGRRSLLWLALSGLCFGLGAASKWTAIYAGAGLAVIWLGFWIANRHRGFAAFAKNAAFCIVFFVIVPAIIYYCSYFAYGLSTGLSFPALLFNGEYAKLVLDNQQFMFSYHADLVAEHPYASRWYQWILNIRPILYYLEYLEDGRRSSFGAFVNPALCWGGLVCIPILGYTALKRRDAAAAFILVGYLAQLVPWMFVNRLTFAYHYFPCTVFLVLALGYVFKLIRLGSPYWKAQIGGFTLVSVALFIMFYPALTGLTINNALGTKLLGWLPTWPF